MEQFFPSGTKTIANFKKILEMVKEADMDIDLKIALLSEGSAMIGYFETLLELLNREKEK